MSLLRTGDYKAKNQQIISKKVKQPTQTKSNKVFCRNCNCQNTSIAKICSQCGVEIREPKLRRKMK